MKTKTIKLVALIALIIVSGFYLSAQNSKKSSAFAIDENITSFEIGNLVDMRINEHQSTPNYGGPNAFSPHFWTITLIMAEGTDVTKLSPIITLAPGATITSRHAHVLDFSKQVNYEVISPDGSSVTYSFLAYAQEKTRANSIVTIYYSPSSGAGYTSPYYGKNFYDDSNPFYCTAYTYSGYAFDRWVAFSWNFGTRTSYLNPLWDYFSGDFDLTVYFSNVSQYTVTVQSEDTNRGTVSGGGTCYAGGSVNISASPKSGWEFDGWYLSGSFVSSSANLSYKPSSSCTLTAKFKLLPPSGPVAICSSGTFSLPNPPSSYTWNKSSNLNFSGSSTGSSVTVTPNGSGAGWVSVTYGGIVVSKDVWLGVPQQTATMEMSGTGSIGYYGVISNSISVCLGEMLSIQPILPPNVADEGITDYEYSYSGTLIAFGYNNYGVCTFVVPGTAGSTFKILYRRKNDCGWSSWNTINGVVSNFYKSPSNTGNVFITYPNPTNGVLNVEIDPKNINPLIPSNTVTTYDIRLFNIQGNMVGNKLTKSGKVQFDVSNLQSGIYYLHIYDGVSVKPEMHPVIIQ